MEPGVVTPVRVSLASLEAARTPESAPHLINDCLSQAFGPAGLGVILVSDIPGLLDRRTRLLASYQRLSVAFLADPVATIALLIKHGLGSDVRMKTAKPTKQAKNKASAEIEPLLPGHTLSSTLLFKWSGVDELLTIAEGVTTHADAHMAVLNEGKETEIEALILSIQADMQSLAATMTLVAHTVATACDAWLSTHVAPVLLESGAAKARLIHYKSGTTTPLSSYTTHTNLLATYGSWQAWHYDYGLLTALCGPMLHAGNEEITCAKRGSRKTHEPVAVGAEGCVPVDTVEGEVKTGEGRGEERRGEVTCGLVVLPPFPPSPSHEHAADTTTSSTSISSPVIVNIPPDCIAIQVGEAAQILSGNRLIATPHAVIRPTTILPPSSTDIPEAITSDAAWLESISRQIFVVFLQPTWKTRLISSEDTFPAPPTDRTCLSDILPALHTRWIPGIDFSEFSKNTTGAYFGKGGMQR